MFGTNGTSGEKVPVVPAAETVPLTGGSNVTVALLNVFGAIVWLNVTEMAVSSDTPVALAPGDVELTVRGVEPIGGVADCPGWLPSFPLPQESIEPRENNTREA